MAHQRQSPNTEEKLPGRTLPLGAVTATVHPKRCDLVNTPVFRASIAHVRPRVLGSR